MKKWILIVFFIPGLQVFGQKGVLSCYNNNVQTSDKRPIKINISIVGKDTQIFKPNNTYSYAYDTLPVGEYTVYFMKETDTFCIFPHVFIYQDSTTEISWQIPWHSPYFTDTTEDIWAYEGMAWGSDKYLPAQIPTKNDWMFICGINIVNHLNTHWYLGNNWRLEYGHLGYKTNTSLLTGNPTSRQHITNLSFGQGAFFGWQTRRKVGETPLFFSDIGVYYNLPMVYRFKQKEDNYFIVKNYVNRWNEFVGQFRFGVTALIFLAEYHFTNYLVAPMVPRSKLTLGVMVKLPFDQ